MTKRCIVFGASSGIGFACARHLLHAGYEVTGVARRTNPDFGFCQVAADLTSKLGVIKATELVRTGDFDALVFSIGVAPADTIFTFASDTLSTTVLLNATSCFEVVRAFADLPCTRPRSIVVISSVHARGRFGMFSYSVSKAALEVVVTACAADFARIKLRINGIRPGPIETPMLCKNLSENANGADDYLREIPMGRFGTTDDLTGLVEYLLSEKSTFVTGQLINVSGGF